MMRETNMITVVCDNHDCSQNGVERTVGRLHLGQGVYLLGTYVCECGHSVRQLPAAMRESVDPAPFHAYE